MYLYYQRGGDDAIYIGLMIPNEIMISITSLYVINNNYISFIIIHQYIFDILVFYTFCILTIRVPRLGVVTCLNQLT